MSSVDLVYSEADLLNDLQVWWDEEVDPADDPFAASRPSSGTIFDVVPVVDSLGVVKALLTIEEHVGFEVPPSVIKRGGYRTFDEMAEHLIPKVRALVVKKKKKAAA